MNSCKTAVVCVYVGYSCELSVATATCLTSELESCRQLHDLEPDNKCILFTTLLQCDTIKFNMCLTKMQMPVRNKFSLSCKICY